MNKSSLKNLHDRSANCLASAAQESQSRNTLDERQDYISSYVQTLDEEGVVEDKQFDQLQQKIQYLVDNKPLIVEESSKSWQQEVIALIQQTRYYTKFKSVIQQCSQESSNTQQVKQNIDGYLVSLSEKQKCLSDLMDILQEISVHDPQIWQQMLEYKIDDSVFWAQEKQQLLSDYKERKFKMDALISNTTNLKKIPNSHFIKGVRPPEKLNEKG